MVLHPDLSQSLSMSRSWSLNLDRGLSRGSNRRLNAGLSQGRMKRGLQYFVSPSDQGGAGGVGTGVEVSQLEGDVE